MGFALSILYFVTYYLTPATVFGPLASFRIELILAGLVFLVSLPALPKSFILRSPQSLALIGMALAVFLSVLIGGHWAGGAVSGFLGFVPNPFAYFLVCLHFRSKRRLQILVLMMLFVCLLVIAHGDIDLLRGAPESAEIKAGATQSPYLLAQQSDAGEWVFRLRGLGEINDPNDFAQLIVCLIPLMFIYWRAKKMLLNGLFVILPVCVLLFGAFLTHSRGSLIAIMAMAVVAGRRRIGTPLSLLLACGLFAAASALHFTGGRELSADSGTDRTDLWGAGLQLLKSHPVFGVGFGRFVDECGCGHTAHNSIVVCAAELGLFGLYFWSLFLFPTLKDALTIASTTRVREGEPIIAEKGLYPQAPNSIEILDKAEINHLGRLVLLSLTGFLVAGWFLSRAYVLTLFLLGGMAEAVFEMALQRGMVVPRIKFVQVTAYAGGLAVALVVLMYIMVLVLNRMH